MRHKASKITTRALLCNLAQEVYGSARPISLSRGVKAVWPTFLEEKTPKLITYGHIIHENMHGVRKVLCVYVALARK